MAKIVQDNIVITVSKITKDVDAAETGFISNEVRAEIEQLVGALLGDGVVVELL